jgi:hypothetical protein
VRSKPVRRRDRPRDTRESRCRKLGQRARRRGHRSAVDDRAAASTPSQRAISMGRWLLDADPASATPTEFALCRKGAGAKIVRRRRAPRCETAALRATALVDVSRGGAVRRWRTWRRRSPSATRGWSKSSAGSCRMPSRCITARERRTRGSGPSPVPRAPTFPALLLFPWVGEAELEGRTPRRA